MSSWKWTVIWLSLFAAGAAIAVQRSSAGSAHVNAAQVSSAPSALPTASSGPDSRSEDSGTGFEIPNVLWTRAFDGDLTYTVAVGDLNGDGLDDVAVGGEECVYVLIQMQDGTLAKKPLKLDFLTHGQAVVGLGDLDQDGLLDIIVGHAQGITVFNNNKQFPLQFKTHRVLTGQRAWDIALLDVDLDGYPDVVGQGDSETNPQGNTNNSRQAIIFYGDGHGGIRAAQPLQTDGAQRNDLEAGDLNSDGVPDLAVTDFSDGRINILRHDGVSGFSLPMTSLSDPQLVSLEGLAIADFNGDGRNDLIASNELNSPYGALFIFSQQPGGVLSGAAQLATYQVPSALYATDLNGDGKTDLLVMHEGWYAMGYYLQGAHGLGQEVLVYTPYATYFDSHSIAVGDLNHDGCKDVVTAHYSLGIVYYYGRGCEKYADLSVSMGLTSTNATVRLENVPGGVSISQPEVRVSLTVRSGALVVGSLPASCYLQSQTLSASVVVCAPQTLAPGNIVNLVLPYTLTASVDRNSNFTVIAAASATTPTVERTQLNNRAMKLISLPLPAEAPVIRTNRMKFRAIRR